MGRGHGHLGFAKVLALCLLAVGAPALAQPEPPVKEPAPSAKEGAEARSGPAREEALPLDKRLERLRSERSGQLGWGRLEDPGARIVPAQALTRSETEVPTPEPQLDRPESLPELEGPEKQRWFQTREWRDRFEDLRRCPGEVAFRRSVRPGAVPAGRVLLRWITDGQGRVRDAAVVAAGARVDPDVMSCIHRKMGRWQVAPRPTPFRADWTLNLRTR
jgi:hypothetical protein